MKFLVRHWDTVVFVLLTAFMIFCMAMGSRAERPPYPEDNVGTARNFERIYQIMGGHQHRGTDSSERIDRLRLSPEPNIIPGNEEVGTCGIYTKEQNLVIFCVDSSTSVKFLSIPIDGASTSWSATAP